MTLTLADLRLAALRIVVAATPLALLLLVLGAGPAPGRTLAERAAGRRGLGPLRVGLAAGATSMLAMERRLETLARDDETRA